MPPKTCHYQYLARREEGRGGGAPHGATLALACELVKHTLSQLQAFDGGSELDDLGDLLTRVPIRLND